MTSPVDVGGLPNHVKYCVSVLSLQWANIRTSPVGIPYIFKPPICSGSSHIDVPSSSSSLKEASPPIESGNLLRK